MRHRVIFEIFRTYELFENRVGGITNSSLRLPGQLSSLNFFAGESTHVLADGLDQYKPLLVVSEINLGHPYAHPCIPLEKDGFPFGGENFPLTLGVGNNCIPIFLELGDIN